ncbi:CRPV-257 [Crowpox virus]|nr:CRPV-257 [Crowpox virus]
MEGQQKIVDGGIPQSPEYYKSKGQEKVPSTTPVKQTPSKSGDEGSKVSQLPEKTS